jgi:hypothetical protein
MALGTELTLTAEVLPVDAKTFLDRLETEWVREALVATGTATVRKRRLPAEQVVWLVIGMAMMRNRSILDVADKLAIALPGAAVAPSAIVQARQKLGPEPVEWLFRQSAQRWSSARGVAEKWRGLLLLGADGTRFAVADSDANNAAFHKHTGGNGTSSYPLMRVLTVMLLRSRICCDAEMGSFAESELAVAKPLWERIVDNSLTIVDKGFFNAPTLIPLASKGTNRHWLTRSRNNSKWEIVQELGPGEQLVRLRVEKRTRQAHPGLPEIWMMRAIHWRDRKKGTPKYLVTSLLDPGTHPAEELRELYLERWEQELAYDDLKTEQLEGSHVLRSRSPEGVRQEIWGTLLAYNLIRLEMAAVAAKAKVPPSRVSFVQSLRLICDEWLWLADTRSPGAIPKHLASLRETLARLILPERRKRPPQPRVVKPRPRKYDHKPQLTN